MSNVSTLPTVAASLRVTSLPCNLLRLTGYWGGAAGYIQVHNSTSAVAVLQGETPVKSFKIAATSAFEFEFGDGLELDTACLIAFSSTDATLTLGAASGDIVAEIGALSATAGAEPTVMTQVTNDVTSGAVWPSGYHKLVSFTVVNGEGAAVFVQLFAAVPTTTVTKPVAVWLLALGGTLSLNFGADGLDVRDGTAAHHSCVIALSSTVDVYTATVASASTFDASYV